MTKVDAGQLVKEIMAQVKADPALKDLPSDPMVEQIVASQNLLLERLDAILSRWNGLMDALGTMHRDILSLKGK